jgi:catechol 2,3-dioxygenase-like lactoylglutathione lyase family enzyme
MTPSSSPLRLTGVNHAAQATFCPKETVHFYRDILGLPLVHAIAAKGWGPADQPDFIHFFFDIGHGDRLAFFYYFGFERPEAPQIPEFFFRSRHIALNVDRREDLDYYTDRLAQGGVPLRYRIRHETLESIYFADPNGYPIEIAWNIREAGEADIVDAHYTIEALLDVVDSSQPSMTAFWERKADLLARDFDRESEPVR